MRKSSKAVVAFVAALAMVALLALPAAANTAAVIVFSGTADITGDGITFPPGTNGPVEFSFRSGPTDEGEPLPPSVPDDCLSIGVVSLGTCFIEASGDVDAVLGVLGPWCGMSTGSGGGTAKSSNLGDAGIGVTWPVSAGSILPLVGGYDGDKGGGLLVGAVQAFGGADCAGSGANRFQVAGVVVMLGI